MFKDQRLVRRMKLAREASFVNRCHTRQMHGDYPVGLHSFNMAIMLRLLWPSLEKGPIPIVLVWAILDHDIPERLVGDTPRNAKPFVWKTQEADRLESLINEFIFSSDAYAGLDQYCRMWLAGLDVLEFYAFCLDQRAMGNRNFDKDLSNCEKFFTKNAHMVPRQIVDMFYEMAADWDYHADLEEWQ